MIACSAARGRGAATEALKLLFSYALQNLDIQRYSYNTALLIRSRFFAKVTEDNVASLKLFENKLGFERISYSSAFKEHTLELPVNKMKLFKHFLSPSQITTYK